MLAAWLDHGREKMDMKRQIVLGFTGALIVGVGLVMGACNKHNFEDTEYYTGVKTLYEKHHSGGGHESHEGAGGDHGHSAHPGHEDHKEHKEGQPSEKADHHEKGHDGDGKAEEHKESSVQPTKAKSLFPKK